MTMLDIILMGWLERKTSTQTNWSESALFVIENVHLYQQPGSCNLISLQLELGVVS